MRCRNTLVNFRRKLRLQLLDLAVEALDGLLVRGFLFLALADSAHQLFDLVRRVACGALPAVAERHLQSWQSLIAIGSSGSQTATRLYGMRQLTLPETLMRAQSAEARRAAPCLYHHGRGLRRQQRCAGVLGTAILSEPNVCV